MDYKTSTSLDVNTRQTSVQSGIETLVMNVIGFASSIVLQLVLYPFYDIHISLPQNIIIAGLAYGIGIPRNYLLRRLFNRWHRQRIGQTRIHSATEAGINLTIGYGTSVILYWYVFPLLGSDVSLGNNAQLAAIFYIFAYIRTFLIRRAFNRFAAKTSTFAPSRQAV